MESKSDIIKLTPEDWLLVLLMTNDSKPIIGKVMIDKEVFLLVKELLTDPNLEEFFDFFPYKLGPYSTELFKLLEHMENEGLINIEKSVKGEEVYSITKEGEKCIQNSLGDKDIPVLKKIENMKKFFHQRGYNSLLRYVYEKYPEYIISSEIRGKVLDNG